MNEDSDLQYANVFRHLGDPVYRVRWHFIRLTDGDLFVLFVGTYVVWSLLMLFGVGTVWIWSPALTLDPIGWMAAGVIFAVLISALHKLRPEGDITEVIRSFGLLRLYAPASAGRSDKNWRPGIGRRLHREEVRSTR